MVDINGRPPRVLEALTPEEIQEAGEKGYDGATFLESRGLIDPKQIERAMNYSKWNDNYRQGYAKYLLKLTDSYNKAVTDGDIQAIKEMGKAKLGIRPDDGGSQVKITVVGADKIKPKLTSGIKGKRGKKAGGA